MPIDFQIERVLSELSQNRNGYKALTIATWNGNEPKLDLRNWIIQEGEKPIAGKGITLTDDEARSLMAALDQYFKEKEGMK